MDVLAYFAFFGAKHVKTNVIFQTPRRVTSLTVQYLLVRGDHCVIDWFYSCRRWPYVLLFSILS